MKRHLYWPAFIVAALLAAGCSGSSIPGAASHLVQSSTARDAALPDFKTPALITLDSNGELEYWPIRPRGGNHPRPISPSLGLYSPGAMAANGYVIAIANYSQPAELVTYDLKTKAMQTFPDPYEGPLDVAIDKNGTLYAMGLSTVAVYRSGSSQPSELTCPQFVSNGVAIAVDNESNVYVNGYGPGNTMGVIEYPKGSQRCRQLHLRKEQGYIAGIGVDPVTDSLIVVDDPSLCAGGFEGRMIIYPKPYTPRTARRGNLGALYCAGTIRLGAGSELIFVADATISAAYPLIDQRTYPEARGRGVYMAGDFGSSPYFSGFTTIPNTLPN